MTDVEDEVRARGACQAAGWLGLPCTDWLPLQVHELRGGFYHRRRLREFPDACLLLCAVHHESCHADTDRAITAGLYWSEQTADRFLAMHGVPSKIVPR